ncbi:MAG: hypothetical protein ACTSP4_09035 [Candidatus Hodarchaeales archaeon]
MKLVLKGTILTPLVTRKTKFRTAGCLVRIINPRRRYYRKLVVGKPDYPYSFICYLGDIELTRKVSSKQTARKKLVDLVKIDQIGHLACEGLGKIKWIGGYLDDRQVTTSTRTPSFHLKIRKGLPHKLTDEQKELLTYALLHDFYHTAKHRSKIYVEPELDDPELVERLRNHHDNTEDEFILTFQKYDHLAAMITRKIKSPRKNRYNWQASKKVDFNRLAADISEASGNVWKLYRFIYQNNELTLLNESLQHGHTSLRQHLLVIANLMVKNIQKKKKREKGDTERRNKEKNGRKVMK